MAMSSAGGIGRAWQWLRALPSRTPLRVKLITALLALVIIALGVISFASQAVFREYLIHQAEARLDVYAGHVNYMIDNSGQVGRSRFIGDGLEQVWVLDSNGQQVPPWVNPVVPPQVPTNQAWVTATKGNAVIVPGQSGDHWLVKVQSFDLTSPPDPVTGQVTDLGRVTVVTGMDLLNINQSIGYLTDIDLLVSGAVIIILALVGIAVVRASLRPLTDIEETAAAIADGDLSQRVPDRDPRTEVGRLGRSLNAMLSQIETAFRARTESEEAARRSEWRMRQFVADASHELRTPLTAIRGYAEYYRQRGGVEEIQGPSARPALGQAGADTVSPDTAISPRHAYARPEHEGPLSRAEVDRIMQRVEQESSRMGVLVEDMLLLARLDQQRPLERHTVDMLTLAADAVHDARVVAPDRNIDLTVGAGAAFLVIGDEIRLRQVIGNLMSNALTHTPDGTPIEVLIRPGDLGEAAAATAMARPDGDDEAVGEEPGSHGPDARDDVGWDAEHAPPPPAPLGPAASALSGPAAVLEVTDHGPGLTPEQAEHVFERFYRADPARTTGGTGLGLAIVAALISAHGGAAWVKSRPADGATFSIALPLTPEAAAGVQDDHDEEPDIIEEPDADRSADGNGDAASPPPWFFSEEDSFKSIAPRGPR
jgi:two-component system, OmpR family, sensor kinase